MADSTPLPAALRYLGQTSKPDPAAKLTSRLLQVTLSSDPPGYALSNRYEQTNHYTGVIYIALKAYMDSIGAAKFTVLERKPKGTVRKSLGMGNYSRDDEYEPADPDHPLCQILEKPGGDDGVWSMGQECVYLTLQHMLTGDAPVWTPTNEDDRPVQFYSLTSALVSPMFNYANEQYPQGAYRVTPYTASGFYAGTALMTGAILPGEEVKRFRMPHPWARNLGMSPLQTGGREIDVLEAITMSRWSYFEHGLQLDSVVNMPGASEDQITAFYEKLNQRNGGAKNARRVLVIGGAGAMDAGGNKFGVSQLGPTNREMDYGNSYDSAASVVMALFRVPKQIGGLVEGTNYSADWAAQKRFYDLGTQPYARNLSMFLTQALARPWCPKGDPGRFKIEVEVPEPRNVEEEAKERQFALTNNVLAVNEYRKATGRRPVEGGDVPLAVWTGKAQQSVQPPEPPPGPAGAPEGEGDPLAALLGGDQPNAGAAPKPANPEAEGSGAPVAKAMSAAKEWYDPAPYGYCPECREPGVCCERRPNGNATCANGHSYPRAKAKYASTQVELTGAAKRKLLAMAKQIPDADLGEDGREDDPHVTARYGLHVNAPAAVAEVVKGFGPVVVRLGRLNTFRGAESGKDYDVIFAEVDSPDLHRLHAALGQLPHTDKWPTYKPHATVAYVKAGLADKYLAALGRVDEAATIDALTFSTAKREHTEIPLGGVAKAMSAYNSATGGALVPTGGPKKPKRKKNKRALVDRVLKSLNAGE
jgi:2'-5' RNA ligase